MSAEKKSVAQAVAVFAKADTVNIINPYKKFKFPCSPSCCSPFVTSLLIYNFSSPISSFPLKSEDFLLQWICNYIAA